MSSADILAPAIQPNDGKIRTTTIRLTPGDQKIVDRLIELTANVFADPLRPAESPVAGRKSSSRRNTRQSKKSGQRKGTVSVMAIFRQLTLSRLLGEASSLLAV